jgi:hypothetical protein
MERAPLGSMYEIVYAVLTQRLKALLDDQSPVGGLLSEGILPQAVNFRALNTGVIPPPAHTSNVGTGSMRSTLFSPSPDERIPSPMPLPTGSVPYAVGRDPGVEANKGLLITRIFADVQSHLPLVMFSITGKTNVPMSVGGKSVTRKFSHNGQAVYELGYVSAITAEAIIVTGDETSTANLQMVVESAFSLLRDHIGTGAVTGGRSWQMVLPSRVTPSTISEMDAPWSQGDDKGGKIYTATVGLEDIRFEAYSYIAKNNRPQVVDAPIDTGDTISIKKVGEGSDSAPLQLVIGQKTPVVVTGMSLRMMLSVSQTKRVVDLVFESGRYFLVAKRSGSAALLVYGTGMSSPLGNNVSVAGRADEPLYQRVVTVSAV